MKILQLAFFAIMLTVSEDHNPSLLIPLSRSPDFLLVFDTHISVYKNLLSGIPLRNQATLSTQIFPPLYPGDSKRRPNWVGWAKAPRNPEFCKEVFYLAREDGQIVYVERSPSGSIDVDDAGEWPARIDTAFACLSIGNSESSQWYPDVLIAGGAGEDGLLCKFGAWPNEGSYDFQYSGPKQITPLESIPSWTPLTDLSINRLSNSRGHYEFKGATLFVANGISPRGCISELRHGVRAFVDDSFGGMNGCTGLWVVDYGSHSIEKQGKRGRQYYATFIITLPLESLVISIDRTQPESHENISSAWGDGQWNKVQIPSENEPSEDHIMRDEETISACCWSEDFSIQITRKEARFLRRSTMHQTDSISFDSPLLMAASGPACPFIAVAFHDSGNIYFETISISYNGEFDKAKNARLQLAYDPTCIELFDIGGIHYVFISTFDSKIALFRVEASGVSSVILEGSIGDVRFPGSRMLCENAAILTSRGKQVLVCATRNGFLLNANVSITYGGTVHAPIPSASLH